eukprot:CAMPEP_0170567162 /NCGR_PEP_ID=MMETSP0211-20121228/80304_1 /TAXON_ID=311385 /ORGANISM="Pseudokeronopsis sp., Strain OXSARD2" /LENGTH=188 /DNA_ID=CAMNT_0010888543 /DNA_START=1633 /DNA_END=2195 /DNA_ORIENTATION=-
MVQGQAHLREQWVPLPQIGEEDVFLGELEEDFLKGGQPEALGGELTGVDVLHVIWEHLDEVLHEHFSLSRVILCVLRFTSSEVYVNLAVVLAVGVVGADEVGELSAPGAVVRGVWDLNGLSEALLLTENVGLQILMHLFLGVERQLVLAVQVSLQHLHLLLQVVRVLPREQRLFHLLPLPRVPHRELP